MPAELNIDSLARGDSHMVAYFLDTWNAANAERATWPTPWDKDYDTREISTAATEAAAKMLGRIAVAWTRHLLAQAGVKQGDTPPPTSSQQRKLVRLLNQAAESDDNGEQVLSYWARLTLRGDAQRLTDELNRLAGDMQLSILNSIVNHVRRTSGQYNGVDISFKAQPVEPQPPTGDPEVDALVAKIREGSSE